MTNISDLHKNFQAFLDESFQRMSGCFAKVNDAIRSNNTENAGKAVNDLFQAYLGHHREQQSKVGMIIKEAQKIELLAGELALEKDQFKALYDSCVILSSEPEIQGLIEFAMDQLTNYLKADRGFLILMNERNENQYVVSKNFDGEVIEQPALEVSSTVIRQTLDMLAPVKIDGQNAQEQMMRKGSFVRLGLCSVICVPVVFRKHLLGAVYLDRKEGSGVFTDRDQSFLIAFAKQIAFRVNELYSVQRMKDECDCRDKNRLQLLRERYQFSGMIGKSEPLIRVMELCVKVAPTEASVLILGESGVGKELIARAIHFNSERSEHSFIAINCGAIPADLLESELFGYEPGAFTGASKAKPGKVEMANHGTLFLDEIAELSLNLQAKILRLLQTHEIERLGSNVVRKMDIRVIAATNQPLMQLVKAGKFREDLYYRLNVVQIDVPPLRERPEDIHLLTGHFIRKYGTGRVTSIHDDALAVLEHYRWDGNIRELENVIQRAVILTTNYEIQVQDLPPEIVAQTEERYKIIPDQSLEAAENDFRKWFVLRMLRKTNNNKAKAAELLGVNRSHFFRILNQLGIES